METPSRHRACNACRVRKVRCNAGAQQRCRECEHLNLRCEVSQPTPRSKRGGRGVVIKGYRSNQQHADGSSLRPLQPNGHSPGTSTITSASPTSQLPDEDLEFYNTILRDYEACVYPFYPIMPVSECRIALGEMHRNREAQAFVYALCAVTLGLAHTLGTPEPDEAVVVLQWLAKAMDALPGMLSAEDITIRRITLVQFIHTSLESLGRFEPAYHYIRQTITMAQSLRLGDEGVLRQLPPAERARRQRLYYLLFVHERYFAMFHYHRISMPATDWLPEHDDTIPPQVCRGFNQIINLFRHIDMDMIDAWLAVTDEAATVDAAWVLKKHRELEDEPAGTTELVGLWPMQQADLIVTKHWMRMILWQIALSKCLLSSQSDEHAMSLLFPVGVSTQLRTLIGQVSRREISINGSGLQQKLFELTDIIAGVVLTVPNLDPVETRRRIDDFRFLHEFWKTLPRVTPTQLAILRDKDEKIRRLSF